MHEYTTPLKTDIPDFEIKRAEAERLAAEIEKDVISRRNISRENGDEGDEEQRWSAVTRTGSSSNKSSLALTANTSSSAKSEGRGGPKK